MSQNLLKNLLSAWDSCEKASQWLERSYKLCPKPEYTQLTDEEWDQLEALAARYARLTDLLIHRLLRALDLYEFLEPGSIIDAANRSVKRGFVESTDVLRDLKDLRNEVVHKYSVDDLDKLYAEIYRKIPVLFEFKRKIGAYLKSAIN
jgi:uncharacterized protein YutE (UPF0331/DUF86 family)